MKKPYLEVGRFIYLLNCLNVHHIIVPTDVPKSLSLSQTVGAVNNLSWSEVNCTQLNGRLVQYTAMITNSSMVYNLTSTERYIIVNDLVFGTMYNISVAAVNSVGSGPFSNPIEVEIGIGM